MKFLQNVLRVLLASGALAASAMPLSASAQVQCSASTNTTTTVAEDFTGVCLNNVWTAINGACLTAGASNNGSIPSCVGLSYYASKGDTYQVGGQYGYLGSSSAPSSNGAQTPDAIGQGALRLTNGSPYYSENGAIVSTTPFPATAGVQITFKTVTYRGDKGGSGGDGADGISFFLLDASKYAAGSGLLGSWGGSLAYTCSNSNPPYTGLVGAYLGLGIDEYGNFLNNGDNTATGVAAVGYGSGQYQWNRIGLRGAGNVAWSWLSTNSLSKAYYPTTLTPSQQQAAVKKTCQTGLLWDYSKTPSTPTSTGIPVNDYAPIPGASALLPSGTKIANESAVKRTDATPIYYVLNITGAGLLSLSYSYGGGALTQILTNQSIVNNGSLPANVLFGFAGSTGGSDNVHEIMCFQAAPADQSAASTTVNLPLDKLVTNAQVYLPSYHTSNWWGQLTAQSLAVSNSGYLLTVSPIINWDAACVLTGVIPGTTECQGITGATGLAQTSRTVLSWNGSGIGFDWANLSAAQQALLDPAATGGTSTRLNYLRGDRTDEVPVTGATAAQIYRDRTAVMGDIIHSSPFWIGPPANPVYQISWADNINTGAVAAEPAGSYLAFYNQYYGRENVVYVGANDGMVHGFRTGSYVSGKVGMQTSPYPNDGQEVLAYVPSPFIAKTASSGSGYDYSSTAYSHAFGVDAPPRGDDLYYNGAWHTWLAGGLGAGGSAIYALDVTDPTQFSESNAASLVVGEWNPSNLTCSGNGSFAGTACAAQLNNTYGAPVIWRFHATNAGGSNMWGMTFGNGFPQQITATIAPGFTGSIGNTIVARIGSGITGSISGTTLTVTVGPTSGGALAVGTQITGTNVAAGTLITSLGSGTGGVGTYYLNNPSTVSSEALTVSSTTLHVTSGSGIGPYPMAITGPGVTAGTTITGQISGTTGGVGLYTVNNSQLTASANMNVPGNTLNVTDGADITVGEALAGSGIAAGTTVTALGTGTGGVGTYTVSGSPQLVASTLITNGHAISTLTVSAGSGLAVGQTIVGPGVAAGTTILSLGTGTGGPGTYLVSGTQTDPATPGTSATLYAISATSTGSAGIYVMLTDPASSAQKFYYLDTGYGPSQDPLGQGRPNGIAYVAAADPDGDNTADYIYAGDLFGNLWRFDVTSSSPLNWGASSYSSSATPTPLFVTTPTGSTYGHPITTKPVVQATFRADGQPAVIVNFGTGQEYPLTSVAATSYAPGQQALYGVWDWDMGHFNTLAHTALASLTYSQYAGATTDSSTAIQPQVVTVVKTVTPYVETETASPVCWFGATGISPCSTYAQFGWKIVLPNSVGTGAATSYEQLIYNPSVWSGILQLNTTVAADTSIFSCAIDLPTGFTMLIDPATGGPFKTSAFLDVNGNPMTAGTGSVVVGLQTNGTGSITNITNNGQNFWLTDTSNGTPITGGEQAAGGTTGHRVTWTELR